MTESGNNLILEMLKSLRNEVRDFRSRFEQDMGDIKGRMSSLESAMITVKREVTQGDEVDARQQVALDRIIQRIERIEHRLELTGTP